MYFIWFDPCRSVLKALRSYIRFFVWQNKCDALKLAKITSWNVRITCTMGLTQTPPQEIDEKTLVSNECFYVHKRIELTRNNSEMVAFVFI